MVFGPHGRRQTDKTVLPHTPYSRTRVYNPRTANVHHKPSIAPALGRRGGRWGRTACAILCTKKSKYSTHANRSKTAKGGQTVIRIVGASRKSYKRSCIFYTRLYGLYKSCINLCLRSINFYTCILVYIFYTCIKILKKYRPETSHVDIFYTRLYTV